MELWLATGNKGKVTELKKLLSPIGFEIHIQNELSFFSQPPETAESFEGNARIKAKALQALQPNAWILADDSGLTVDGLGGLPGVHSARYAGPRASFLENNLKLLKMMGLRCPNRRKAQFHCCLLAISPQGEEFICQGKLEGEIAKKMSGQRGFGYDPLFIPTGEKRTLAEMDLNEKNSLSHRSKALKKLVKVLKEKFDEKLSQS